MYMPRLKQLGLTYPQYLVLVALYDKQKLTVNELGRLLDLEYDTLSPMLKRMTDRGLISKVRSTEDERIVELTLLSEGKLKRQQALQLPQLLASNSGLTDEEWQQMVHLTEKMFKNISE
ncbi:MarR family transcriptional regulator [Leuconostoc pseudomesenteroides]|nr:MarR family transcriptional regulator [Leuconostoc pseudomesenteroides]QQB28417.1 MarR family transcriptional regulator [Leuconostoc pseudomesenteroides]